MTGQAELCYAVLKYLNKHYMLDMKKILLLAFVAAW
jgi:hypothetical protein